MILSFWFFSVVMVSGSPMWALLLRTLCLVSHLIFVCVCMCTRVCMRVCACTGPVFVWCYSGANFVFILGMRLRKRYHIATPPSTDLPWWHGTLVWYWGSNSRPVNSKVCTLLSELSLGPLITVFLNFLWEDGRDVEALLHHLWR